VQQTQQSWVGKVRALPDKGVKTLIAQAQKRYKQLKTRYGPRYTTVMVTAPFFALFVPIPGISLLAVALVVAVAEVHRAMSRRGGLYKTSAVEIVVSMNCAAGCHQPLQRPFQVGTGRTLRLGRVFAATIGNYLERLTR